jgi:hypothetical protein
MMPGDVMTALGALLAGLVALGLALYRARLRGLRDGRTDAINEGLRDAAKRMDQGRQAVQRGRDGGKPVDQRLRDNDGRWR